MSRMRKRAGTKSKKIPGSGEQVGTQYLYPVRTKYHRRGVAPKPKIRKDNA